MERDRGPDFQPTISLVDFNPFIKQGVVDNSKAIKQGGVALAIDKVGQAGVDAFKGKVLADLESEQEGIIQNTLDTNFPKQPQEAQFEFSFKDLNNTFTPIEKKHSETLDKFRNAFDQGAISEAEFQTRILASTREAVNRAPGFFPEILEHSRKVLELSGISGILKSNDETLKSQRKQLDDTIKNIVNAAEANNVPLDYSRISGDMSYLDDINRKVIAVVERKAAADVLKNAVDTGTNEDSIESRNFVNSELFPKAVQGTIENFNTEISKLASTATSPQDYAGFLATAKIQANSIQRDYLSLASKFASEPRVKVQMDLLKGQLDSTIETLSSFKSGEDAVKYMSNIKTFLQDSDVVSFIKTSEVSPTVLDFLSKINPATVAAMATNGRLPQLLQMSDYISKGYDNIIRAKNSQGKPLSLDVFSTALENPSSEYSRRILNNAPSSINKDVNNPEVSTRTEAFSFQTEYVKRLAQEGSAIGIGSMDSSAKKQALDTISAYTTTTVKAMNRDLDALAKEGKEAILDILPDGRLHVSGDVSNDFVDKYITRINDSISAMSNVMGGDSKKVAEEYFYPQFFGDPTFQAPPENARDLQVRPEVQQARDKARLRILLDEQKSIGGEGVDVHLDKEINVEKKRTPTPSPLLSPTKVKEVSPTPEKKQNKSFTQAVEEFTRGEFDDGLLKDFVDFMRRSRSERDQTTTTFTPEKNPPKE